LRAVARWRESLSDCDAEARRMFDRLRVTARLALCAALAAMVPSSASATVPARPLAYDVAAATAPVPAPGTAPTRDVTATLSSIHVTRELAVDHWLRPGEFAWDAEAAAVPGQTIVVVNIRARVLSAYRDGVEIGRSSLIYGADNKPTPTGTFPILQKDADHWSNLYDAPMPHTLRLTWDGVAIHGSPTLEEALATRGCVGLPVAFARLLFDQVRVGDRVVIWDGVTST
jgi:lipoprotein-anchoring transpeptidase ErfK/SrfK